MKKIIYSLVIMIAAGSLFTSCIDPVEPNGIYDLREAKADYLAALSNLRAADAKVKEADAALVNAQAAVQQAIAAQYQANADWQKLLNELKKAENEKEKAELQAAIDSIKIAAQTAVLKAQENLAKQQQSLENALKNIAAEAMVLTQGEKDVITRAVSDFNASVTKYNNAYTEWAAIAGDVYASSMNAKDYEAELAEAQADLAKWQSALADFQSMDNEPAKWKAVLDQYKAKVDSLNYAKIMLDEGRAMEYLDARDAFAALVEYAQGLVEELGTNPSKDPLTALVEYDDNQLVYDAIEVLVNKVTASANANNWKFGEGVMGFEEMGLEAVKEILFGNKAEGGVDSLGLVGIVDILTREGIITNADYAKLAGQADTLKLKIDSVYAAHKEILEKGIAGNDSIKAAYTADTTAQKAKTSAANAVASANAKLTRDSSALVQAVREADAIYDSLILNFVDAFSTMFENGYDKKSINDTTRFLNALEELAAAQVKYFGKQDSLVLYNGVDDNYNPVRADLPIGALVKAGFVQTASGNTYATSLYGGDGYGAYYSKALGVATDALYQVSSNGLAMELSDDPFLRVVLAVFGIAEASADAEDYETYNYSQLSGDAILTNLNSKLINIPASGDAQGRFKDTLVWAMKANLPAYDTYKTDSTTLYGATGLDKAYDTASANAASANAKLMNAYKDFYAVYDAFWGYPAGTHNYTEYTKITDSLKVNWTEKTFEGILTVAPNLVDTSGNAFAFNQKLDKINDAFNSSMYVVSGNAALAAVLDALRKEGVDNANKYADFLNPENSHIIKGQVSSDPTSGNATEYVQTLYAAWLKAYYNNYTENQDAVIEFKENVNALVAAYDAQVSANAVAQAAYDEAKAAIIGEESSANADVIWGFIGEVSSANATNDYTNILNELSGCATQADLAKFIGTGTFAAEASDIIGDFVLGDLARKAAEAKITKEIGDIESVVKQLVAVYNAALQFKYDDDIASGDADDNASASANAKVYIDNYNALVADIESKISDAQVRVDAAKVALDKFNAGVNEDQIWAEYYAEVLGYYEQKLADAKAELDFYRAQYEAVMKKFFGQNN